ncbi:MAG: hypothetical protein B7Y25_04030 [Alphaproteobacteria bacterium 16-39-46]|nr:MAG: hypothetical protein B7Y25_04030 [Alphaproteobacteria bacterium 16-39-46]OZA43102.1 MAG: hypothetical protein B7X84_04165 [Alphaproteobacteria bacterium 17-39-52]HQS84337.1 hypothetical protein [Alphaproteobacteria bacterium]HQS93936.1 hypothetical protein [Alphaproteobacteria bacterium]
MLELFTKYPFLLNYSIEDPLVRNQGQPNQPNNSMVFFALEHGKRDWLQSALPHLEYLHLIDFLNPDLLSEFFQKWLPKCSDLHQLSTHSKIDKDFVYLSAALPSLTRLLNINLIIFGSNSFIPNLPGSIETCKIVPMGAYLYRCIDGQYITEINRDSLIALISPLLLFFEQHPDATFELSLYSKLSTDQQEIKELLNVSQFPKERFSLTHY